MLKNLLIITLSLFLISSCSSQNETSQMTVEPLEYGDEDYNILRAAGVENSLIFTLNNFNGTDSKNIEFWVDYYKEGQLFKEKISYLRSNLDSNAKEIKLYFSSIKLGSEEVWVLSMNQKLKDGYLNASIKGIVEINTEKGRLTEHLDEAQIQNNISTDIGIIVIDQDMMTYPADVEQTIKENEEVYVLRVKIF